MSSAEASLLPAFASVSIRDALPEVPKVHVIRSDMTIQEAVEFLHQHNILSAPVRNVEVPDSAPWKIKYTGMMDMIRACVITLNAFDARPAIREEGEEESMSLGPFVLEPLQSDFTKRRVCDLTEANSGLSPFMPLEQDASLLEAMTLLGAFRLKRLPIISGPDGDICSIVSQTTMLNLLHSNLDKYGAVADRTLRELDLCTPVDVKSVRADAPVRNVFKIIREHNVSGVPIIGHNDEIVGNISARHVYFVVVARNKHHLLEMSCSQFLRVTSDMESSWNIRSNVIACVETDTLRSVIKRLVAARIHRVYLLDGKKQIIRVIALCDVLAKFGKTPEEGCCVL